MPYDRAWRMICDAQRVLMTTHVKPDGDGMGALAALAEHLCREGKTVRVVLPSAPGLKYRCVPGFDRFEVLGQTATVEAVEGQWDLVLVADTCTWGQLDGLRDLIERHEGRLLVIDHHVTRDELKQQELIDETAAATGQIVMRLLESQGATVTPTMAKALFISLVSDTGWMRFPNVTPEVLRMAARLMELGAEPSPIYEELYQSESPAKMALIREALTTLTICDEGDVAWFWLTPEMFARTGAVAADTENIIDECQRTAGVIVGLLFVEEADGTVRVSLRSKRQVDVARVAGQFGGGGHARAAGCRLRTPLAEARRDVLAAVYRALGREPSRLA
ncbi:MAG: DHH family phosphoesterase [Planctomycetes bacterium]|nr:DHH family phosphoesterase [Planctomycetota bacterium]